MFLKSINIDIFVDFIVNIELGRFNWFILKNKKIEALKFGVLSLMYQHFRGIVYKTKNGNFKRIASKQRFFFKIGTKW